ncbi:MAG: hypothetical protein SCH70_10060 [Candidatus Methanoperedens sp.]|nr:hypothetical protein [Candidatus Methanoperedens sp.]
MLTIFLLFSQVASATPEYAVKESRNCPFCHASDGPPQLNERGEYYGINNHSLEGFVPSPASTPEPENENEIGVHMNVWVVGSISFAFLLLMLVFIYVIRL